MTTTDWNSDSAMMDMDVPQGWKTFFRSIIHFTREKLPATIFIIAISSILEGFGLMLLLPIGEIVFSQERSGNTMALFFVDTLVSLGAISTMKQLAVLSTLFLVLIVARAYVLLKRDKMIMELSQGYVDHIRVRFFSALSLADWPTIKQFQRANLLDNMTTNIARIAVALKFLSQAVVTIILLMAYIVSAFFVNISVGSILVFAIIAGIFLGILWARHSRTLGVQMTGGNRQVMGEATRFLEGLKAAKTYQAEKNFVQRFRDMTGNARKIAVAFTLQQAKMRRALEIAGAFGAVMLLLVGYGVLQIAGAELLLLAAITIRINPSLASLISGLQSLAFAMPAFLAAEQTRLSIEAMSGPPPEEAEDKHKAVQFRPADIEIEDISVTVSDGETKTSLLQITKLVISKTGLVHVTGPSGAGKSTFAELLAGLYLPDTGSVEWNGLLLSEENRSVWQQHLAFVPQEPFMFDGTVRENLSWPNTDLNDEEIWEALGRIGADNIVHALPAGLDEQLYDNGARLSGGQRQRLCLARGLLRRSSLLILDEALSALDNDVERIILSYLTDIAQHQIVILVSHSTTADDFANQRIEITDGKVSNNLSGIQR